MKDREFVYRSHISRPAEEVFAWHLRPCALERVIPPWLKAKLLFDEGGPDVEDSEVALSVPIGPIHLKWLLKHVGFIPDREFTDVQVKGPFSYWRHVHRVRALEGHSCELEDEIHFAMPFFSDRVRKELEKALKYRHEVVKQDLSTYARYSDRPLRILVSGTGGLMGKAMSTFLSNGGHQVVALVRSKELSGEDAIYWNPKTGEARKEDFEDFDAVIHLAGENIAKGRWTEKRKEEIFLSRCRDTWLLSQILLRLYRPPPVVITASACGYYGDQGEEILTEESARGKGFLADVCKKWEEATQGIENRGSRVVHARFGAILTPSGGMLQQVLLPFRLGLGGKLGDGQQFLSWIAIDDAVSALYHCLQTEALSGPVNITSPEAVRQAEFASRLAHQLKRPAILCFPKTLLRAALGELADEMLLSSMRAFPKRLLETGYVFRTPHLQEALDFFLPT